MAWDEDFEYANGADGTCQTCGAETDQPWHAYCGDCYAKAQGWTRPEPVPETPDAANGMPSPPAAYFGNEKLRVAWLSGFRSGWQAALDERARRAA